VDYTFVCAMRRGRKARLKRRQFKRFFRLDFGLINVSCKIKIAKNRESRGFLRNHCYNIAGMQIVRENCLLLELEPIQIQSGRIDQVHIMYARYAA
jgi:hypothetical protein